MTQEDKELLLKDLCARLPYRVKVQCGNSTLYIDTIVSIRANINEVKTITNTFNIENVKPYLRPMSSMTDEEKKKLGAIGCEGNIEHKYGIFYRCQDWLNEHHFDYRELIDKGLAIEVTEENNPYKD